MSAQPPNKTCITHNYQEEHHWLTFPPKPDLSSNFLRHARDLSDDRPDIYLRFYLHHPDIDCQVGESCDHWEVHILPRGGFEVELICMRAEDLNGPPDDDWFCAPYRMCVTCCTDQAAEITCAPCKWFNEVRPNFLSIEKHGWVVVLCRNMKQRLFEDQWMDRHGRMLVHMGFAEDSE